MREYFGADRTTVTYEHEITGVGGNAEEFFVLCEVGREKGKPAVRTTVYFTHEEMAHLLADYRQHHPIKGQSWTLALSGPQAPWHQRIKRVVEICLRRYIRIERLGIRRSIRES
jgi:hypothetical protein